MQTTIHQLQVNSLLILDDNINQLQALDWSPTNSFVVYARSGQL